MVVSLGFVILAGLAGIATWFYLTRPLLGPVERGRRLAEQTGCFACHGPDGRGGVFNADRSDVVVPGWGGDLMMFARDSGQIREWIRDGITKSRASSETWQEDRDKGALDMPAFGKKLSESQISDLVRLVMAVNGMGLPEDSLIRFGYHRADSLGCFGCHGPGGNYSRPNAKSFKGYIPAWEGADFPDLVRNRAEFDEWVRQGISARFSGNRLAAYFLNRAAIKMPPFKKHLKPGDLDALWAYLNWLRSTTNAPESEPLRP